MNLTQIKSDIEEVAAKVLNRPVKVEQVEQATDQDGERVEGIQVDGWIVIYPVMKLRASIAKVIEVEEIAIDRVGGVENPDMRRYPFDGHTYQYEDNAIVEVIALLARLDAEAHLIALGEVRYLAERDESAKALESHDA